MTNRVVITGMGAVSPLGKTVKESWDNAINGISGVGPITLFDPSELGVQIACEVKDFDPNDYLDHREARRRSRFQQLAAAAAQEALMDSGVSADTILPERVGMVISSAVGGLGTLEEAVLVAHEEGARRISPFMIPMLMANGPAGMLAIDHGFTGPALSVASACASGSDGIGQAWLMIRSGIVDVVLAGASESTITYVGIGGFDRLGALSRRNEDFSMTPAPFDVNRDGLVMGEGAAILVLENLEHARNRSATILAEMVGYGSTADAFHITAPAEDGAGGAEAMRRAMSSGGLAVEDVDYINAHGTGTDLNDISETRAIKSALGEHAYKTWVSSTKSMTGHMMGATGALESIFAVKAIQENVVPPTIHLQEPDPECDLDYVPNQAREGEIDVVLNNAFGFGGHNAVLAFRKFMD